MGQVAADDLVATAEGEVFALDGLGAVVGVQRPTVLAAILLGRTLAHDLLTGNRLAFADGVTVADVEDQAGWAAHGLDADQIIRDEAWEALADEGEGEPGEVGDVTSGGSIFEEHATLRGVPGDVLIFEHHRHEAVLGRVNFRALAQDWCPLFDQGVFLAFDHEFLAAQGASVFSKNW